MHGIGSQLGILRWHTGQAAEVVPRVEPLARGVDALPTWISSLAFLLAETGRRK
jgi:hypothetical protein